MGSRNGVQEVFPLQYLTRLIKRESGVTRENENAGLRLAMIVAIHVGTISEDFGEFLFQRDSRVA
jgi:hypothetical protein